MKTKEVWWCIFSGEVPLAWSCRTTRKQAIADCISDHAKALTWDELQSRGYTVRKIQVTAL
jgi:hypothetical protein